MSTLKDRLAAPKLAHIPTFRIITFTPVPQIVADLVDTRTQIEQKRAKLSDPAPQSVDYVIWTNGGLNSDRERYAARLGQAYPVILPAAFPWLASRISMVIGHRDVTVIVNAPTGGGR